MRFGRGFPIPRWRPALLLAAGTVTGTASGTIAIGGSASATVAVTGSATGAITIAGSGAGVIGNPPVTGSASGSVVFGGAATGTVAVTGSASGGITIGGSATGTVGAAPPLPTSLRFRQLEVFTTWPWGGGTMLSTFRELTVLRRVRTIGGTERWTLAAPLAATNFSDLRPGRVFRAYRADGSYAEGIVTDDAAVVDDKSVATLQAAGLAAALAQCPPCTSTNADGVPALRFDSGPLTMAQQWTSFIQPAIAAGGLSFVVAGTFDPTLTFSIPYSSTRPWAALLACAAATQCELDVTIDTVNSQYQVHVRTKVASGQTGGELRVLRNATIKRTRSQTLQVTRGYFVGAADASMAEAVWKVSAKAGNVLTLVDPAGGAGPILVDTQLVGYYLEAADRVTRAPISVSSAALQQVTATDNLVLQPEALDLAPWRDNGAAGTVTANTTLAPDGTTTADTLTRISGVNDGRLQTIAFTGDGPKAISWFLKQGTSAAVDFFLYDNTAAVTRQRIRATWTAGVPVLTTVAGTGTLFIPTLDVNGFYRIAFAPAGIVAANNNSVAIVASPAGANGDTVIAWGAKTQNASILSPYQAFTVGDLVRVRLNAAGTRLIYLEHPTYVAAPPAGYGVKADIVSRPDLPGVTNLVPNATQAAWAGGASSPADGWAAVNAPTLTRTTTSGYYQTAGQSCRVQTTADGQGYATALFTIAPTVLNPFASGFVTYRLTSGAVRIELVATDGVSTWIVPDGIQQFATDTTIGTFVSVGVAGINLQALGATSARLRIVQHGPGTADFYVDAAQYAETAGQQPFIDGAGATKGWQAVNAFLALNAPLKVRYDGQAIDFYRLDPGNYSAKQLVPGATHPVVDEVLGYVDSTRVLELDENWLQETDTIAVLSSRPEDIGSLFGNVPAPPRPTVTVNTPPVGGARTITDAVVTASANTVGSASAGFTAADIGKTLWILSGASDGTTLKTTITGRTSAVLATMGITPTVTRTGLTAVYGNPNDVATLASSVGGNRAGSALFDTTGKLTSAVSDSQARAVNAFLSKLLTTDPDTLDAVVNGLTYIKQIPLLVIASAQTAVTATTVTVSVVAADPTGGAAPTISWDHAGSVTNNGGGSYTIARAAAGSGPLNVLFTASKTGRQSATALAVAPEQLPAASLVYNQCQAVVTAVTATTITVTVTGVVASGTPQVELVALTGSVTLNSGTAAGTLTTNGSVWVLNRGAFAAGSGQAQFRAVTAGAVSDDDFVDIPEVGRDTVYLASRARVTASTATTVTVRYAVADPYPQGAASVAVAYLDLGSGGVTPVSPGTVTPAATLTEAAGTYIDYTITRPAFATGSGRVTFTATNANRVSDSDAVDIPAQEKTSFGPSVIITPTPNATTISIAYSGVVGTLTVSIDGAAYAAPAASPISVNRDPIGGVDHTYAFKCVADGQTMTETVHIVPLGNPVLVPIISAVPGTQTATTQPFVVSAIQPTGVEGTPSLRVLLHNTTGSGSVSGAIAADTYHTLTSAETVTINRPAFNAALATASFEADNGAVGHAVIARTILNHDPVIPTSLGPTLTVQATPSVLNYSIAYSGDSVDVSIDGAAFGAPATATPLVVTRNATGGADKSYTFRATKDSQSINDTVIVGAVILPPIFTSLTSVVQHSLSPNTLLLTVNWTLSYAPSGYYAKIYARPPGDAAETLRSTASVYTYAEAPYNSAATFYLAWGTEASTGSPHPWAWFFRIEIYNGSNVLLATESITVPFWATVSATAYP